MTALITGASSGIGMDIARELSKRGYDLILVARREGRLVELKNQLETKAEVFAADLTDESECRRLCEYAENFDIGIAVNNAGFGIFGEFTQIDLNREIQMLNLNVRAVHILTKFFIELFAKKNEGILLNVASSAAFLPGPYMSAYYASKAYVLRLSQAVNHELSSRNSNVHVSVLCPGPVDTEFNKVADVSFGLKGLDSKRVAKIAVDGMLKGKKVIVPGFLMKCTHFFSKILPDELLVKCAGHFQVKKTGGKINDNQGV